MGVLVHVTYCYIESKYPNCGIIIAGDFNNFNTSSIQQQYELKQMVKFPTRGTKTLDKLLTNLFPFYSAVKKFSPFGLSDHCTVVATSGVCPQEKPVKRTVRKRSKTK